MSKSSPTEPRRSRGACRLVGESSGSILLLDSWKSQSLWFRTPVNHAASTSSTTDLETMERNSAYLVILILPSDLGVDNGE